MKSIIVIYYPTNVDPPSREEAKQDLDTIKESCEILLIEDPNRTKIEVEVFFQPE